MDILLRGFTTTTKHLTDAQRKKNINGDDFVGD